MREWQLRGEEIFANTIQHNTVILETEIRTLLLLANLVLSHFVVNHVHVTLDCVHIVQLHVSSHRFDDGLEEVNLLE